MLHSTPFLLFDGNCAEAMTFYQSCFGGELTLTKLGDTPMKAQFPLDQHDRIIYAELNSGAINFSASDWMASPELEPKQGNTFSIFVVGDTYDELKTVFDKLSEGIVKEKIVFIELQNMPFGIFGQLKDKFNVSWKFRGERKE